MGKRCFQQGMAQGAVVRRAGAAITVMMVMMLGAGGAEAREIENWRKFHQSPREFMESHLTKFDANGKALPSYKESLFSERDIRSGRYMDRKIEQRKRVVKKPITIDFYAGETGLRRKLSYFLDLNEFNEKGIEPLYRLEDLDAKNLANVTLSDSPWTGSYWPIYQGMIAARYGNQRFMSAAWSFDGAYRFVQGQNSLAAILERGDSEEMNLLSPAEKYDILIGTPVANSETEAGFLTAKMWSESQSYRDENGNVETWFGLCHGWAPASFMMPRPAKSVLAAEARPERNVKFYPADMKGLATHLWAVSAGETTYLGERCNKKKAKIDPATGRVMDPECFDVNPGIWHLVMTNQMGQARRSLVMDATYDYEVWNQPISSYEYRYFNPQTGQEVSNYKEAMVARADFKKDKFAKFRSKDAKYFVGVEMSVKYVAERFEYQVDIDSAEDDVIRTVTYMYDLELDANGEVIGGEWYQKEHPDFLWLPRASARAVSVGDMQLPSGSTWTPAQPLPQFWKDIAVATAVYGGQPLAAIVEALIASANAQ